MQHQIRQLSPLPLQNVVHRPLREMGLGEAAIGSSSPKHHPLHRSIIHPMRLRLNVPARARNQPRMISAPRARARPGQDIRENRYRDARNWVADNMK